MRIGRYPWILEVLDKYHISVANMRVVDCGCGDGVGSACLERAGAILTAIDLEEEFVQKGIQDGLSDVRQGDLRKLDLPDNCCDFFFCSETLEHLESPDCLKAALEIQRVVKSGGIICVTVPGNKKMCFKKKYHKTWVRLSDIEEWFSDCEIVYSGQHVKRAKQPNRSTLVVILKRPND